MPWEPGNIKDIPLKMREYMKYVVFKKPFSCILLVFPMVSMLNQQTIPLYNQPFREPLLGVVYYWVYHITEDIS